LLAAVRLNKLVTVKINNMIFQTLVIFCLAAIAIILGGIYELLKKKL